MKFYILNLNKVKRLDSLSTPFTKIQVNKDYQPIKNIKRYIGPFSKEWKNSMYFFNKYTMRSQNLINNRNINKMIQNYFLVSFRAVRLHWIKRIPRTDIPFLSGNMIVSSPDIKYTASKVIIRLFIYNPHRKYIAYEQYVKLHIFVYKQIYAKIYGRILPELLSKIFGHIISTIMYHNRLMRNKHNVTVGIMKSFFLKKLEESLREYLLKYFIVSKRINNKLFFRLGKKTRTLHYLYLLDKYKFEETKLLSRLTRLLNKFINKKIEYNIINLKSLVYSPDIFTKYVNLSIKRLNKKSFKGHSINKCLKVLRKKFMSNKSSIWQWHFFKKVVLEHFTKKHIFTRDYVNANLIYLLKNNNMNSFFKYIFPISLTEKNNDLNILSRVFGNIKYKRIMGIKIDINGRLTRRYRADRSKNYRLEGVGSILDIYARQGFYANYVKYRGFRSSHVIYSTSVGKTRVGSYGIKGWVSSW
jgi:hypothetical protein